MALKLCPQCKRPFLESEEFCPRCPQPYDAGSWANLGCILLSLLPLAALILFWVFVFTAVFYRVTGGF